MDATGKGKAVIWDLDGVIVDSGPSHFRSWQEVLKKHGIFLAKGEFLKTFGMRNEEILTHFFGPSLSEEEIKSIGDEKEEIFRKIIRIGIHPFPGVLYLIRALKQAKMLQAIASSTPLANIEIILETLGIRSFFNAVVSGEEVIYGKPNPETFLKAADKLRVNPHRCVVIEDAEAGIIAAKRAGMKAIGITNTLPSEKLSKGDLVLESLEYIGIEEIIALVR